MTDAAGLDTIPDRWVVDNEPSERWPIYTRGNVGEVFPDVLTPLSWSLNRLAAESGWRAAYRQLGIARPSDFTQELEILGVFNGYCYLNASLLRVTGVRTPGGSPEAIDIQLIGDSTAPPYEKRDGDNALSCRLRMLFTVRRMLRESGTPELGLAARELAATMVAAQPSLDAPDEVLLAYLTDTYVPGFTQLFEWHINLTTQSALVAGYLSWLCLRAGDLGLQVGLTTDLGGVESAAPGEAMWKISRLVRSSPAATSLFDAGLDGLEQRLRADGELVEVVAALDEFLAEHGHRGPNEWEMASATWGSNPSIALAAIDRMRLAGDERGPEHQRTRASAIREDAEAEMRENLSWIDRRSFAMVMEAGAAFARGREMTRNQNIVALNAARQVLYELARRAHERGGAEPTGGFMLEWDDFVHYLTDPEPYRPLIAERAELRDLLEAVDPPFVIASDLMTVPELLAASTKELTIVPAGTELQGNAGSPGVAQGRARVVLDPAEPGQLSEGDILIAPLTDPSWTPLFLAAAGVVVDVGATVSHAVVVSRELCIPCVVGIHDATEIIPDGSLVEIDGAMGVVRVIQHPDEPGGGDAETVVEGADESGGETGVDDPRPGAPRPSDVSWITDPLESERADTLDRLGGKGTALAEMAQHLDLPVPPAFIITTEACRSYMDGGWPSGLEVRLHEALDELGPPADRRFGDPAAPLLVAIRSGAPVSMPGMMDTILNVGINPEIRDAMAAETGRPAFAAQTWLRFCRMYAETVLGIDRSVIERAVGNPDDEAGYNAAADRLRHAAEHEGGIPLDPHEQVRGAVEAVFRSWNSPRAVLFRGREGIDDHLGTAVVVQAMVFGNLDEHSGTGVVFTRDPASGVNRPYGDYLARAQGEDVVAGTHEVHGLDALHADLPAVYDEILEVCDRLERHYRDMCDIEFTVARGRLYVLQTRVGRRSPEATIRIAAQMAEDPTFPLSEAEAVARVDHATLEGLAGLATVREGAEPVAAGIAASPGVGFGVLSCDPDEAAEIARTGRHVVLVRAETSPSDVHGMVGAAGLVTTLGGSVSHAAVVARSWGIPAVTGAKQIEIGDDGIRVRGRFIPVGATITVDGTGGRVFEGDQLADHDHDVPELDRLRQWALELGVELGERVEASPAEEEAAHRDIDRFGVMRALQLKGVGTIETIAHALDTDVAAVETIADGLGEWVDATPRGLLITPAGREWLDAALAEERANVDRDMLTALYERFLPLNRSFKALVTDWQTSDQGQAALADTISELGELHGDFRPIVAESVELAGRLAPYSPRFEHALEALDAGDLSMLASPLKDSYHTVWFEYHEELIHLVGRTRLEEERHEVDS